MPPARESSAESALLLLVIPLKLGPHAGQLARVLLMPSPFAQHAPFDQGVDMLLLCRVELHAYLSTAAVIAAFSSASAAESARR